MRATKLTISAIQWRVQNPFLGEGWKIAQRILVMDGKTDVRGSHIELNLLQS